jgi:hypothetical protein
MSRVLSFPKTGNLKLYQTSQQVHMGSLKNHYNDLFPNTSHTTKYKYVEPDTFIPIKHYVMEQTYPFIPENDRTLLRALNTFQKSMNIPYDSEILVDAKRTIIGPYSLLPTNNDIGGYPETKPWSKYDVDKVGIMVVSQKNIVGGCYQFRIMDNTDNVVTLHIPNGFMCTYDERNIVEHRIIPMITKNDTSYGIRDELLFTVA